MLNPRLEFRLSILSAILLAGTGVAIEMAFENRLPPPLLEWQQQEWERDLTARGLILVLFSLGLILVGLAAAVGLWFFWRPARPVGVGVTVIAILVSPAFGPSVSLGWGNPLIGLGNGIWIAILVVAYTWPPIRSGFSGSEVLTSNAVRG